MTNKKKTGAQRAKAKAAKAAAQHDSTDVPISPSASAPTSPELSAHANGSTNGHFGTSNFPTSNFDFNLEEHLSTSQRADLRKQEGTKAYKSGKVRL